MAKTGNNLRNKKILITSGPTWVPIDEMRVISNRSTGRMGHALTRAFAKAGAKVTLLEGPWTQPFTPKTATIKKFYFYEELLKLLQSELKKNFDIVVHAAAVSDYKLKNTRRGKLPSGLSKFNLALVPTQKIINKIRTWAPKATLVGFKLEPTTNLTTLRKKAMELIYKADCDFVVANSLTGPQKKYRGWIINGEGKVLSLASSRENLAKQLVKILKGF